MDHRKDHHHTTIDYGSLEATVCKWYVRVDV